MRLFFIAWAHIAVSVGVVGTSPFDTIAVRHCKYIFTAFSQKELCYGTG